MQDLTSLLSDVRHGDRSARDRLFELLYEDLRRRARFEIGRAGRAEMDTTAVVHEAYVRLSGASTLAPEDRAHFLRIAARAMRYVLVDQARARSAGKRGGSATHVTLRSQHASGDRGADDLVALHEALLRLEEREERLAQVVQLRFFAGLSVAETAEALGISERSVKRDWRLARAVLHAELAASVEEAP